MELLIAGGIAWMGYSMAEPGREPRASTKSYAKQLGPSIEYAEPGNDTTELTRKHVEKAEKRWRDARDPALTGIVTPHTKLTNAMLPFFTSAKKQNTNDAVKQTLMETFTGANAMDTSLTGTYRRKQEVESMFPPSAAAGPVTSDGSMGNTMYDREDERYAPGIRQNNVLPAPKVYVGRGVGVGPDVAATDGFHPMLRVMTKNVGEYRKNNLPGRNNHGAASISKTTSEGPRSKYAVKHTAGALITTQARRPMLPSKASVNAAHVRPLTQAAKRPKVLETERFGNPRLAGHETRGFVENRLGYEEGRDNLDRNHTMPHINLTGSGSGVGAFSAYAFDGFKMTAQQRETPGANGFLTGPVARQAPSGHLVPPTQRNLNTMSYTGGVGRNSGGMAVRHEDDPRVTLRDTQGHNPVQIGGGAIAAVKGGALDNIYRFKRLDRQAKRKVGEEWQPLPGRVNVVQDAWTSKKSFRADEGDERSAAFMPSLPNKGYQDALGRQATPSNKLPNLNPRLDLTTAVDQLKSNPYARSLWNA